MNNNIKKILFIFSIIFFLFTFSINVFASNEELAITSIKSKDGKDEFLIYINDHTKNKFKYAFTNKEKTEAMDLNYINSVIDNLGNQVAILNAETYEELSNEKIYMWVKDENGEEIINGVQLDLSEALSQEKMQTVETITKKIEVEIADTKEKVEATNPISQKEVDGVTENVKVGYIKIVDNKDAKYYYRLIKTTDSMDFEKLMELAKEMSKNYEKNDMYGKINICKEFYDLYTKLIEKTNWEEVENMTINQPEESVEDDEYVVFIKKVEVENETVDVQFLTSYDDYKENVIKEQIVTQETTKLPITYDNIILLIIAFVIIVFALVIIFIRIRKLSKRNEKI